jgi:hypothetical protein
LHDIVERLAAILKFTREEVHEVVIGIDELGANEVALGWVLRVLVATMKGPQLLAGRPRLRTHC